MKNVYLQSDCCGVAPSKNDTSVCPVCRLDCKWIEIDEDGNEIQDEPSDDQIFNNHCTEGGISFSNHAWNGR